MAKFLVKTDYSSHYINKIMYNKLNSTFHVTLGTSLSLFSWQIYGRKKNNIIWCFSDIV